MIMKKVLLLFLSLSFSLSIFSQVESMKDTIKSSLPEQPASKWFSSELYGNEYEQFRKTSQTRTDIFNENRIDEIKLNLPPISFYEGPPLERVETRMPFANDYNYSGGMIFSDGSWISGVSSHETILTYGSIRTASAMYNRRLSRNLTIAAGPTINKYESRQGQFTTATLDAMLNYRLNNRMNISAYGQYSMYRNDRNIGSFLGGLYPENPGQMSYGFTPVTQFGANFNYQVNDWLFVSPGVYGSRYEFFNNHFSDYGLNAAAQFRVNERVKFNIFGKRSMKGSKGEQYGTGSLYPQNSYGGSMEYWFSNTFGVEAGMIREINPFTGKWENKPYVMPLINIK